RLLGPRLLERGHAAGAQEARPCSVELAALLALVLADAGVDADEHAVRDPAGCDEAERDARAERIAHDDVTPGDRARDRGEVVFPGRQHGPATVAGQRNRDRGLAHGPGVDHLVPGSWISGKSMEQGATHASLRTYPASAGKGPFRRRRTARRRCDRWRRDRATARAALDRARRRCARAPRG